MPRTLLLLCLAFLVSGVGPLQTLAATPQLAQAEPKVLPEDASPAAGRLEVTARCDPLRPGESVALFSWSPVPGRENRQRLDVTAFRTGFADGDFETVAELPASQQSVEWRRAEAGINYYWRVLTLTDAGWVPSAVARFEAPTCPVDYERSQDERPEGAVPQQPKRP